MKWIQTPATKLITQTNLLSELNSSLKTIQPNNSELTQTITYTLIATAIVGIMVYHYIKNQEEPSSHQELPSSQRVLINSIKEQC